MEQDNFFLDLIASLKKNESKKQIKSDINELNDIKIPLIGTLNRPKTRKQLKEDIKSMGDIDVPLTGKLNKAKTKAQIKQDLASADATVKLTGKFDSRSIGKSVQQVTSKAQKEIDSQPLEVAFSVKKEKLINDIKLLGQQNSRLFKDTGMSVKYNSLLDSAEMARNTVELSTLRTQLGSLRSELKVTGNAGLTMTDTLKNGLSKVLQFFGGHGIITQFTAQLRNAWAEAKELDSALTDLSRVSSDITRGSFSGYLDRVISKTKELSVAAKDYIDAVTTFSRAGYSLVDSEVLAGAAVQLEKVGDMSAEAASKSLLSGLQAYGEIDGYGMDQLAEKAQALNDKIDIIGNTASITQKEVAEGIQAVGSVMGDANTSVDEFISLLAAGNRSVQDSDKVALAIRTSALRIRGCTSELEEMGETTDDVIESTSTLAAKIKALTNIDGNGGVNILEADGETFRSIYDIYNDIAKVYNKMSDVDASSLLELIAGKNRSNQISAVLQNMSEANVLLERSLNAAGTASAEYEIYLNSAEAASERFGIAMTETYNNILSGETVKGLTNAGTAVLEFANKWGIVEGTLKGFLALGILKGITTLTVAFKNSAVQVSNYGAALNAVKDIGTYTQGTRDYAKAMNTLITSCANLTDAQLKQVLANKNLGKSQLIEILQLDLLKEEEQEARLAQLGLVESTEAQTAANGAAAASTFSLKSAMSGLGATIKSVIAANKLSIAIMGISAVIGIVTTSISKYNQKLEESRQKAAELANAHKEQQAALDAEVKKYQELKESLDSGNLSAGEARSVKEQLLEIQNSLVDSYGAEASNIDLVNGKYQEQLGLLTELSKEKASDFVIENRDVFEEAKKHLEKEKTFDLGTVTSWSKRSPITKEQQDLLDYIETYSQFLHLTYKGGADTSAVSISVKADVQNADEVMRQFAKDLEEYGNTNGINVSGILDNIPEQLRNAWTDELKEYKSTYDEFIRAEIIRSDALRPLYQQSIQAVEEYNKALSSGDGVAEAKTNLDSIQQSVQNMTGQLEGSQDVFDGIFEGINRNAETAYQISQAFENDTSVQRYAEQLRGLSDIDLKAINFEDNVQSPGEDAFGALIEILGLSEDQVQKLIDKLVELEYIQGEVQGSIPDIEVSFHIDDYKDSLDDIQASISTLRAALDALNSGNLSKIEVIDLMQQFPELVPYIDLTADGFGNLSAGLSELIEQQPISLIQSLEALKTSLTTDAEREQVALLIDSLQRLSSYGDTGVEAYITSIGSTWGDTANVIGGVTTQFENLAKVQEAVADGLTMSANAAAELAGMYPEILTSAEVTADGQITLNADVVKSVLDGDKSVVNAQIAKLEADKAVLTAKKSYAEAQLNIAKQVGEGEGQISKEIAQYRLDIANSLLQALIDAGMQEDRAYAAVAANMAGNMDEYNRIVGEVAQDTSINMDAAAVSMAESISINSVNAQTSFENIQKKVWDLADAIKAASSGNRAGNAGTYGGGGSKSKGGIKAVKHSGDFNTVLSDYKAQTVDFADFKSQLEVDIKGYTDAISNIDTQIGILKNLQATFETNGGIGGHGYADKLKELQKDKDKINNALKEAAGDKKSSQETIETFDWIETVLSRIQRTIKNLGNIVSATWRNWTKRNTALSSELKEVRKEISMQESAYKGYMKKAESVGLSDYYKELVKNGDFSIQEIANDSLKAQIRSYKEWYEKALDAADAVEELNNKLAELEKTKFDHVSKQFDDILQKIESKKSLIDESITQTEEQGYLVSIKYYEALLKTEKSNLTLLEKEREAMVSSLNDAVAEGAIEKESEEWYRMCNEINEVTLSIEEANTAVIQYGNSIRDIEWSVFDLLQEKISHVTSEAEFLIDLLSNDKLYDDKGQLTNEGMSTMGLHGVNYNTYMEQADKYAQEMLRIDKLLANDPHNQELANRRQELLELQQEMIVAAEGEKEAIVDMVEEGIQLELSALKELIDTYTDALDSQKDLYNYQKKVKEQTAEIASIQKQLSAYTGDMSEETKAKVQKLTVSLEDAKENLEETQYDQYISDQKKMLDNLYNEYESILNQRLDNIDALIADMITQINNNASIISTTLCDKAESVGYMLSDSMAAIWNTTTSGINQVLTVYGSSITNGLYTVNSTVENVIGTMGTNISNSVASASEAAANKLNSINSSIAGLSSATATVNSAINTVNTNLQNLISQISASTKEIKSSISSNAGSSDNSGSSGSDSGSSNNTESSSEPFRDKEDGYDKNKLNTNTSIVDRLKYNNFDSSYSARKEYFNSLGGSGTYTGSASQNEWLIEQMKLKGYKNGVLNVDRDQLAWTQEGGRKEVIVKADGTVIRPDGSVLTPLQKGDSVFNPDVTEQFYQMVKNPEGFFRNCTISEFTGGMNVPPEIKSVKGDTINNFETKIEIDHVMDYEDFVQKLPKDKRVVKFIQAATLGEATGGSKLKKYQFR